MMEETKRNKILLILGIVVIIAIVVIKIIIDNNNLSINSNETDEYEMIYKKYDINEYSVINISDEQLANIYLNNFRYYLFNDIEFAYNLLDEEYRNIKFGSIDSFREYVNNSKYSDYTIEEYSISNDKKFIEVHILNDKKIIFKINSVLDYKVYLDNTTIEIS